MAQPTRRSTASSSPRSSPACPTCGQGSAASRPTGSVREVGDGNLNLVFIVEGPAGGLVVKQALPYVRLVGEAGRCRSRARGSSTTRSTSRRRYAPRLTPQSLPFRREPALIVMDYL